MNKINYLLYALAIGIMAACTTKETRTETNTSTTTIIKEADQKSLCDCVVEKQNNEITEECVDLEKQWISDHNEANEELKIQMETEVNNCLEEAKKAGLIKSKLEEDEEEIVE